MTAKGKSKERKLALTLFLSLPPSVSLSLPNATTTNNIHSNNNKKIRGVNNHGTLIFLDINGINSPMKKKQSSRMDMKKGSASSKKQTSTQKKHVFRVKVYKKKSYFKQINLRNKLV